MPEEPRSCVYDLLCPHGGYIGLLEIGLANVHEDRRQISMRKYLGAFADVRMFLKVELLGRGYHKR
ncbi:MAG: hypothetical protein AUI50_03725 [Crenarchaeota archaeon 13_1_40CM_2_52_14]|nr:MAG: hypothetical protein AUI50_03725 [Crenarchaeota archaeon 13_1_40CM_2_52_14]